MSVINQLLLDLEKRRASNAERGLIPNHVRALPEPHARPKTLWIATFGGVLLSGVAAWLVLSGGGVGSGASARSAAEAGVFSSQSIRTPGAAAPVTSTISVPDPATDPAGGTPAGLQPAARLSFELSRIPPVAVSAPPQPSRESGPGAIATGRVIGSTHDAKPASSEAAARQKPPAELPPAPRAIQSKAAQPAAAVTSPDIDKRLRQPTVQQLAEGDYREGTTLLYAGRSAEARAAFEAALRRYPQHSAARQALVGLLVDAKELPEAERVLQEGLELAPNQIGFAMAMARLQVDRGDVAGAIGTLQKSGAHASGSAEYSAFLAALLQREKRYAEAADQFVAALRLKPNTGVWLLGLGMSLEALNRNAEAREAFTRARTSGNLKPDLQAFADQRLQALR